MPGGKNFWRGLAVYVQEQCVTFRTKWPWLTLSLQEMRREVKRLQKQILAFNAKITQAAQALVWLSNTSMR